MGAWIIKRLIWAAFQALSVASLVFVVINLIPGDPVDVILGNTGFQGYIDVAQALRHQMGLDLPLDQRYFRWIRGVAAGDLGNSLYTDTPVLEGILRTIPRTLQLVLPAIALGVAVGISLGVFTAVKRGTTWDVAITWLGVMGYSLPVYITGTLMIYLLSIKLRLFAPSGYIAPSESITLFLKHATMPILCLSFTISPITMRMTRSTMLEVLGSDYVRTARAKGVRSVLIYFKHALRNALIPVLGIIGLQIGYLFGGATVTELVFNWPGLSLYLFSGIFKRDYPIVQGVVLLSALIFIVVNLLTDLSYALIDPRVRYT